jgi:hypothetical protein
MCVSMCVCGRGRMDEREKATLAEKKMQYLIQTSTHSRETYFILYQNMFKWDMSILRIMRGGKEEEEEEEEGEGKEDGGRGTLYK